ncbi:MAG: DsrE family protein [Thermoplasmata archaeon]|nr:MAG: DsrE family protein [Thermoplasmata archaeon]
MVSVVIEISRPPFGSEHTFAGLYVASASLSKGIDVIVLLRGDGVYTGRKGQIEPQEKIHLPPTENLVEDVIELSGRVVADNSALELRGIAAEELIEGIEILDTEGIHDIILEKGEQIVVF